jgi:hypothetical protein
MYGVMVVPITATARNRNSFDPDRCGQKALAATSPQSGWASTAATG